MLKQLLAYLILPMFITAGLALPLKAAAEYQPAVTGAALAQEASGCEPVAGERFNRCASLDVSEVIDTRGTWGEMVCEPGVTPDDDDHWTRCSITEHAN